MFNIQSTLNPDWVKQASLSGKIVNYALKCFITTDSGLIFRKGIL